MKSECAHRSLLGRVDGAVTRLYSCKRMKQSVPDLEG